METRARGGWIAGECYGHEAEAIYFDGQVDELASKGVWAEPEREKVEDASVEVGHLRNAATVRPNMQLYRVVCIAFGITHLRTQSSQDWDQLAGGRGGPASTRFTKAAVFGVSNDGAHDLEAGVTDDAGHGDPVEGELGLGVALPPSPHSFPSSSCAHECISSKSLATSLFLCRTPSSPSSRCVVRPSWQAVVTLGRCACYAG